MAFYTLNVTVQDGILPKPHKSTVSINFTGTTVLAWNATNLQALADTYLPLIDDLIDGKIVAVGWVYTPTIVGGLKAAAEEFADVEEGALFMFQSTYPYTTRVRIPTFKESAMLPNSKQVDQGNAAVIAFEDAMIAGTTISTVLYSPSDSRGVDITALISAVDAFQKDRG